MEIRSGAVQGSARLPDLLRIELAAEPGGQLHRFTAHVVPAG